MNRRFWATVSAATVACALVSGPGFSQSQLRDSVSDQLARLSISVPNFESLTDTQVAQIALILNSSDSASRPQMVSAVVAERQPCVAGPQLRAQVAGQLTEHNITIPHFDTISGTELVMVEAILNTTDSEDAKRRQIDRIFASDSPIVAGGQLRADVEQCVKSVNADVDLGPLSAEQLVQIELVAGGTESEHDKRLMIEQIANK